MTTPKAPESPVRPTASEWFTVSDWINYADALEADNTRIKEELEALRAGGKVTFRVDSASIFSPHYFASREEANIFREIRERAEAFTDACVVKVFEITTFERVLSEPKP